MINTNWAGDVVPDADDIAQFDVAGTATTIGISMNGATNNGPNNQAVGAIELLSTRNRTIGNSSSLANGTLTLNGATVNGVANTILRNASAFQLTLQNNGGGSSAMDVALNNATDNIINIDGNGGITISSVIKNGVAGAKLTFNGNGTGILRLDGAAANTYTGLTTVNSGEMDLAKTAGLDAIAGNLTIGDNAGLSGTATVKLINADQIANTSDVTINSDGVLNLNGNNETIDALSSGSSTASVLLGSGTLTVGAGNQTIFSYAGTTSGTGGLTKSGSGILILSGANGHTGDTTIKAGEVFLTATGSLAPGSTIRLGDTIATSPSAMFTFGSNTGGVTLSNTMIVQTGGPADGKRTLLGLAENGATNTWAGNIILNSNLTVQSAAAGGSVTNGQGILLFQGGSIDVGTRTLTVDSNLRGNNADTYSIQGIVIINELLGTTQATGGSLVKDGSGTLILQGTSNNYTGTDPSMLNANGTRMGGGVLGIYGDGSLGLAPTNATNNLFFTTPGTTTNIDSIAPTLRAETGGITLAATRNVNIASSVTGHFDSNGNTFTINGVINGGGNLAKTGAGTLVLNGANTYTGTTTINAGTLNAATTNALGGTSEIIVNGGGTLLLSGGGTNRIADTSNMTLNGGTFATGGVSEHGPAGNNDAGIGMLTLQSSSIIDLGDESSILAFANSATQVANWNGTLSIYNWTGNLITGNGFDQLYFGSDTTGLAPSQLLQISFYSDDGNNFLGFGSWGTDLDGEVVPLIPVPEPATWIGAALGLAGIAWTQRRRFAAKS